MDNGNGLVTVSWYINSIQLMLNLDKLSHTLHIILYHECNSIYVVRQFKDTQDNCNKWQRFRGVLHRKKKMALNRHTRFIQYS